jgi:putative spermidine/putrescine transport system permease protein
MTGRLSPILLNASIVLALAFIFAPIVVILGASIADNTHITFPPTGFTLRWYARAVEQREIFDALRTSLVVASLTTVLATLLGVPAAIALVRGAFPGRAVLMNLFLLPLVFPVVMLGVVLLQWLQLAGLSRGTWALVLGHTLITMPYVVRLTMSSLSGVDPTLERAAANLGASPLTVFMRVTLPLAAAGIVAGAAVSFIVSFDDVTLAVFLSSAREMTVPVRLFSYVQESFEPLIAAMSGLMVLVAAVFIIVIERLVGVAKVFAK